MGLIICQIAESKCFFLERNNLNPSSNSCVLLSTSFVVRSFDPALRKSMLDMFVKNQAKFEWLTLFNNNKRVGPISLYDILRFTPDMNIDLC